MTKIISKTLKPEKIKPGLRVLINWYGDERIYYHGKIVRKLRKNWLVEMHDNSFRDKIKVSVPPNRLTLDVAFKKDGRPLLATQEDYNYMFSQEHTDWAKSMMTEATT